MEKFQKAKVMTFSRVVHVGHNVIEKTGCMCKDLELDGPCLIVTGKNTVKIAGNKTKENLEDSGYDVHVIELEKATKENVDKAKEVANELNVKFLLGVGGGSKIDIAKLAAKELKKPFISIPTCASHDGIASPRASITGASGRISLEAVAPLAMVADTAIILKAPYRTLAAGCGDVISNLTAAKDWLLASKIKSESFSSSAAVLAEMSARIIIENASNIKPNSEESVWLAIKSIIESSAAMCIAGSSRPCSGSEHLFSHALDILAPGKALHGEQCGLGTIMMMYLHNGNWQEIRDALRKISVPTTAKQLNIDKEIIINALTMAHKIRPDRYTILGDEGLSSKSAEKLAIATGVI